MYDKAMTAIVIDNGSGVCRTGFAGDPEPMVTFSSVVARYKSWLFFGKHEVCEVGGEARFNRGTKLSLSYPVDQGVIQKWDDMEEIWHFAFTAINAAPEEHPVLLTEKSFNTEANKKMMVQVMLETFNTPAIYIANQALLSLRASCRTTGIVLDSGDAVTHIVPVYENCIVQHAVMQLDLGGRDLTDVLTNLLMQRGLYFPTKSKILQDIKEKLCYTALDFEQKMVSHAIENYELPDGEVVPIGEERFLVPEVMFQPLRLSKEPNSVHKSLYESAMKCDSRLHDDLFNNIVLSGGNTLFPGFAERLKKEISALAPPCTSVNVIALPERRNSAWLGGSLAASLDLDALQPQWISREEYREYGTGIIRWK